jgi:hypothetical protein
LENISSADVDTAINNALADMNNLSTDDVQDVVDSAIGELNNLSYGRCSEYCRYSYSRVA